MVTSRYVADIGYKAFSGSMMLLTLYGGYLCSMRTYRYFQRRHKLKEAAENQTSEIIKD
nr:cytochrome c oxidase assembly protein COX14 isoform X2 [Geotrypetes seraphini]XP_033791598.1 cytochrome c oxidase assembly protein COX14 isoform X2 [Geotrypetes seraphini]XP_033791599.1 cytochrome c oxidase assembly protein COX14 isoform X2 [Geotrypetes seraphini]XP_033791600.1 cytochrome c oxidase assembly protein COX14 isoform X2 [Geotrypetes seraphini]